MTDGSNRPLTKTVDLGWSFAQEAASNRLTLLGMADLGNANTDSHALPLSYDPRQVHHEQIARGEFGLAVKNATGKWINAVTRTPAAPRALCLGLGTQATDLEPTA